MGVYEKCSCKMVMYFGILLAIASLAISVCGPVPVLDNSDVNGSKEEGFMEIAENAADVMEYNYEEIEDVFDEEFDYFYDYDTLMKMQNIFTELTKQKLDDQEEKDNEVEADNKKSSNSDNSSKTKENLNDHQMFLIIFIPNEETFNDLDPSGEALADINEVGDDHHETDLLPALIIAGSCFILIVTILKCFVFKSS